jgi:hypothetical protein
MPMARVLNKIPLDHATKAVLLGQPSELRPAFQLMLAHESGEGAAAAELSRRLQVDAEDVSAYYGQAQEWARGVANQESRSEVEERLSASGFRLSVFAGNNWSWT